MEPNRFDTLSKSMATTGTRRGALRAIGGAGMVSVLLSAFGVRRVAAQQIRSCTLDFTASVLVGPGEGDSYNGLLTLEIAADGAIDQANLASGNDIFLAVGQATGRMLALRIELEDEVALSILGVGERDVVLCRGDIAGTFAGPDPDAMGVWRASASKGTIVKPGSGESGTTAEPASAVASAPAGGSNDACPGVECGSGLIVDPATCECGCPDPYLLCGTTCCLGGSVCDEARSYCYCSNGSEPCGGVCTTSCSSGQQLDQVTCQCLELTFCDDPLTECFGSCADLMTNSTNCGSCGYQCQGSSTCVNGLCQSCAEKGEACDDDSDCCNGYCDGLYRYCVACGPGLTLCGHGCFDLTSDYACGSCDNQCAPGTTCQGGLCIGGVNPPVSG